MDDADTLHRRARLRELISVCFDGKDAALLDYIEKKTGTRPNQGEMSGLQKDHGPRSFGSKKATTLEKQIGLPKFWFALPKGQALNMYEWRSDSAQPLGLVISEPAALYEGQSTKKGKVRDWPLPAIPRERIESLDPAKLERLQGAIALALAQIDRGLIADPKKPVGAGGVANMDLAGDPFASLGPKPKMPWEPGWKPEDDESVAQPTRPIQSVGGVVANVSAGATPAANDKFDKIPELGEVRLAAGDGFENDREHETGYLTFRRSFLRSVGADGSRARVVYAHGDSMEPVIQDGAALLVVPDDSLTLRDLAAGGIYAINYDGKMIVKTIVKNNGRWVARSYNPAYMDIPLEDDASVRVLGRVVWAGAKLPQDDASQWVKRGMKT